MFLSDRHQSTVGLQRGFLELTTRGPGVVIPTAAGRPAVTAAACLLRPRGHVSDQQPGVMSVRDGHKGVQGLGSASISNRCRAGGGTRGTASLLENWYGVRRTGRRSG